MKLFPKPYLIAGFFLALMGTAPPIADAKPRKATRTVNPQSPGARQQRAMALVRQAAVAYSRKEYKRTISLCRTAADWYPTYARAYIWMGAAYQKVGNRPEARSAYKWVIALAPKSPDATRARRGLREIGYSSY